jgi:hypothetical protein
MECGQTPVRMLLVLVTKGEIEMEKYLAGFIFKSTHREIHYLCSVRGRSYSGTYTRLPAEALQFDTREAALAAIEKKLRAGDRGRSGGYEFTAVTQKVGDYDEYRIHISV